MGGRLALVIGSECHALGFLGFARQRAVELHVALVGSDAWRPAATGPVIDPDVTGLKAAVSRAFATADAARATLLLAFVGHGVTMGTEDFFLLAQDSPADPDSENGFNLVQGIRERMKRYSSIDGLVVLIDACEAGEGLRGAARRWDLDGAGRIELLVASTDGSAFNGCFTSTLLRAFKTGVPHAGESLRCQDVQSVLKSCPMQDSGLLAFSTTSGSASESDDGLWLVPNVARHDDAVRGTPWAGLVDRLTQDLTVADSLRENLTALVDAGNHRLRLVTGPAGCGKSTMMAVLIRPSLVDTLSLTAQYVTAAIFLDTASTIWTVTDQLVNQFQRVPGFTEAAEQVQAELTEQDRNRTPSFDIAVVRPLQRCQQSGRRLNVLIDGLDQPEDGTRALLVDAIRTLIDSRRPGLQHVRVIVTTRTRSNDDSYLASLGNGFRIALRPPEAPELVAALRSRIGPQPSNRLDELLSGGGWLTARLLNELTSPVAVRPTLHSVAEARLDHALRDDRLDNEALLATLSLLIAAGPGPVLPLELLMQGLAHLGSPQSDRQIRDLLVHLGQLITRGHPGTPNELVGIAHDALVDALTQTVHVGISRVTDAHHALADALSGDVNQSCDSDRIMAYATAAKPRHLLYSGRPDAALAAIRQTSGQRAAADNRDLWATWLPLFVSELGPDHPDTLKARRNLALFRAEAGDAIGAVMALRTLVADQSRTLGPDHRETLRMRNDLAWWQGRAGDAAGAEAALYALLADEARLLGPDDPDTLNARNSLAVWRGWAGDAAGAAAMLHTLLADQLRVQGPDHSQTLGVRYNLAEWRGRAGDAAGASAALHALLADRLRVLGPDHPETLRTRHSLALWLRGAGNPAGAGAALRELLADRLRVLGPDHPDTLNARNNLAVCRGEAGDVAGAVAALQELLADRLRILDPDHPDTLRTRNDLGVWRGEAGDAAGAVAALQELLADRLRVLGRDHRDTLNTRNNLAVWRMEVGDVPGAAAAFQTLLADQSRLLGPDDRETLKTRNNLALSRGRAGDAAGAAAAFQTLLDDQSRVVGPDDPETLRVRHNLAWWRGQAGDAPGAVAALQELLADRLRVLGPDHRDTLNTRDDLAWWQR